MAEFMEVMRTARRMCISMGNCEENCPLHDTFSECSWLHNSPEDINENNLAKCEAAIMKWAAENPELRYPTWDEWQQEHFRDGANMIRPCEFMSRADAHCFVHMYADGCRDCANQPIPADIAQKLGIQPIPAEPRETLVDEYERLHDRAENLNLYLNKLREVEPWVFECVKSKMDGMPGYVEVKTE